MRIALLQYPAEPGAYEQNLHTLRSGAAEARSQGASLLVTPELFVSGYATTAFAGWHDRATVETLPNRVAEIAATENIAIVASMPRFTNDHTTEASQKPTISASLWDASGAEIMRYDKVHLWDDEPIAFQAAAEAPTTIAFQGWNIGFQICYDIEFPEPTRYLAGSGATLVIAPTAIAHGAEYVTRLLVPARAAENNVVVVYVNHPETPPSAPASGTSFYGLSVVTGPEGVEYARAGNAPELLICDLPEPITATADYLTDRRPQVYDEWDMSGHPPHTAL